MTVSIKKIVKSHLGMQIWSNGFQLLWLEDLSLSNTIYLNPLHIKYYLVFPFTSLFYVFIDIFIFVIKIGVFLGALKERFTHKWRFAEDLCTFRPYRM